MNAKSNIAKFMLAALTIAGCVKNQGTLSLFKEQQKSYRTDEENPKNFTPEMRAILEMRSRMNLETLVQLNRITPQTAVSLQAPVNTIHEWKTAINKAAQEKQDADPGKSVLFFEDISQIQKPNIEQEYISNGRKEQRVKVNFAKLEKMVRQFGGDVDLRNDAVDYAQHADKIRKGLVPQIGPEG